MKRIILLIVTVALITACKNVTNERYTQNSLEIETYKNVIKDYEMANWESYKSHYADTAKIFFNVTEKNPKSLLESIEQAKSNTAVFSSYGFVTEENEYEMVLTDDGNTWVNFWGIWQGRLTDTNQLLEIPVHTTAQFVDGKIVKEHGYWDNSVLILAIQKIEENK